MHEAISGIPVCGILAPDEVYVFSEAEDGDVSQERIGELYTVRSETDILAALAIYYGTILSEDFEFRSFLGKQKVSEKFH